VTRTDFTTTANDDTGTTVSVVVMIDIGMANNRTVRRGERIPAEPGRKACGAEQKGAIIH
jgi:hypothetical protein